MAVNRALSDHRAKVSTIAAAARRCRSERRRGRRVVFTNGCFDLLHPGHVRYLAAARRAGDLLVVAINSDRSVRRLKGPGRPVQHEAARAEVLAALAAVDLVVIFDEETPLEVIRAIEPDVLAKGADWKADAIVGADLVRARGGKVLRVALVPGESTTRLVARSRGDRASTGPTARSAKSDAKKTPRSGRETSGGAPGAGADARLRRPRRPTSATR